MELIDDLWSKWSIKASTIFTAAWAALALVWSQTDAATQGAVLARFGLGGATSGELLFYVMALAAVSTAVIGALRSVKQTPPESK